VPLLSQELFDSVSLFGLIRKGSQNPKLLLFVVKLFLKIRPQGSRKQVNLLSRLLVTFGVAP
jgi:hypothetical protein